MRNLVIASGNAGKVREFGLLLKELGLVLTRQPAGILIEESGDTFAANARLKAIAVARSTKMWSLADDSGLSVDALNGAPGVNSARYASTDGERIEKLLSELIEAGVTNQRARSAQFTSALALASPDGEVVLETEGKCHGEILTERRGNNGFGYDPIFFVPETKLTFAEMSEEQKSRFGHRGKAVRNFKESLELLGDLTVGNKLADG